MEPPWAVDDLTDDLESLSFNSTATTTTTDINRSISSSSSSTFTTKHSSDPCWDAIRRRTTDPSHPLVLSDLKFIHKVGAGDIGCVYLAEMKCRQNDAVFAAKVMDKKELASRNKEGRARTEREILEMLEHPFLPTLYGFLDSPKWSCLLTEFCPGGDLHVLRQRQPARRFHESAVRYHARYCFK